jgi:hypothetical protein
VPLLLAFADTETTEIRNLAQYLHRSQKLKEETDPKKRNCNSFPSNDKKLTRN